MIVSMSIEHLRTLLVEYMLGGVVVGALASGAFWCALTTRVISKYGWSRDDEEI